MAKGGARIRSGPRPDPNSERSERRGYTLKSLPAEGYEGKPPRFPLPARQVRVAYTDELGRKRSVVDEAATKAIRRREMAMWRWAWSTPQACAWALPSQQWRIPMIAMWVRTFVVCEGPDATAADKNSLHRFADQIGLTTAGLAEMGWAIADPVSDEAPADIVPARASSRSRIRRVK